MTRSWWGRAPHVRQSNGKAALLADSPRATTRHKGSSAPISCSRSATAGGPHTPLGPSDLIAGGVHVPRPALLGCPVPAMASARNHEPRRRPPRRPGEARPSMVPTLLSRSSCHVEPPHSHFVHARSPSLRCDAELPVVTALPTGSSCASRNPGWKREHPLRGTPERASGWGHWGHWSRSLRCSGAARRAPVPARRSHATSRAAARARARRTARAAFIATRADAATRSATPSPARAARAGGVARPTADASHSRPPRTARSSRHAMAAPATPTSAPRSRCRPVGRRRT